MTRTELTNSLHKNKIVIVEGFDMVGKTSAVERFFSDYETYFATHDLTDVTIGRDNSWTIGYGVVDLLSQMKTLPKLVINRGVVSSAVYSDLYGTVPSTKVLEKVLDWYACNEFFAKSITHIYVSHFDYHSAKVLFENSQKRQTNPNELSAKLDKFKSFDAYWNTYNKADELFRQYYRRLGIVPQTIETLRDFNYLVNGRELHTPDGKVVQKEVHIV